jgi:hypothetical protein
LAVAFSAKLCDSSSANVAIHKVSVIFILAHHFVFFNIFSSAQKKSMSNFPFSLCLHSEAESEAGATSTTSSPPSPGDKLPYQLPVAEMEKPGEQSGGKVLEREVEVCTLIWALSTVLPLIYFGQKDTGKLQPEAKVWSGVEHKIYKKGIHLDGWGGVVGNSQVLHISKGQCKLRTYV